MMIINIVLEILNRLAKKYKTIIFYRDIYQTNVSFIMFTYFNLDLIIYFFLRTFQLLVNNCCFVTFLFL